MNNPKISAIIPSYNGESFIADAIQSIHAQSYSVAEIIVVDDGSTDKTEEIVNKQTGNIRFIIQEHAGKPAAGRNRGIKEAKGEYIAFLDQDDVWPEDTLNIHIQNMIHNPKLDVDVGKVQKLYLRGRKNGKSKFESIDLPQNYYLLSSALFRKTVFDNIGLFDETMKYFGSDFDWILRARELGVLMNVHDKITLFYRLHNHNDSKDKEALNHAMMEVLKKSMDRRREHGNLTIKAIPKFNKMT